jgi:hypothetical protein
VIAFHAAYNNNGGFGFRISRTYSDLPDVLATRCSGQGSNLYILWMRFRQRFYPGSLLCEIAVTALCQQRHTPGATKKEKERSHEHVNGIEVSI